MITYSQENKGIDAYRHNTTTVTVFQYIWSQMLHPKTELLAWKS